MADEPAGAVAYLLEDEFSSSHWGRRLFALTLMACCVAAGWHWRQDLREWALKFSERTGAQTAVSGAPSAMPSPEPTQGGLPMAAPGTASKSDATEPTTPTATPASPAATPTPPAATPAAPADTPSVNEAHGDKPGSKAKETQQPQADSNDSSTDDGAEIEAEGERYLYGTGVRANCAQAQKTLQFAAARSNAKADSVLGTMYATGHCAARDLPLAYRWFAKALQQQPDNRRLERDLQVLWNQMNPEERQIAMHHD